MKRITSVLLIFITTIVLLSAQDLSVNVQVKINGENLKLEKDYTLSKAQYQFDTFKFYIGKFNFLNNGKLQFTSDEYFLVDLNDEQSLSFLIGLPEDRIFNEVQFAFGVDSALNDGGVQGGSLDPTLGMYWAWQSGYINFKMEGAVIDETKTEKDFQFHLGGFLAPNRSEQTVRLKANQINNLNMVLNLDPFLVKLDLNKNQRIMSPGPDAVKLMTILKNCFYLNQ